MLDLLLSLEDGEALVVQEYRAVARIPFLFMDTVYKEALKLESDYQKTKRFDAVSKLVSGNGARLDLTYDDIKDLLFQLEPLLKYANVN